MDPRSPFMGTDLEESRRGVKSKSYNTKCDFCDFRGGHPEGQCPAFPKNITTTGHMHPSSRLKLYDAKSMQQIKMQRQKAEGRGEATMIYPQVPPPPVPSTGAENSKERITTTDQSTGAENITTTDKEKLLPESDQSAGAEKITTTDPSTGAKKPKKPRRRSTRAKKPTTDQSTESQDKEKLTTDIYSSTSTTMTPHELPRTRDQIIKKYGRIVLSEEIKLLLNEALQKTRRPHLKDEVCVYHRLKGEHKKYGDYLCRNILRVCELLRSKDPKLFKKTSPKSIAKEIIGNFPKSDMIKGLTLNDVGFLSFKLAGEWMVKRIHKHLKDGIAAWAPLALAKRAIVDYPTGDIDSEMRADHVRSSYIRDALVNMFEYSGIEVSSTMRNDKSLHVIKRFFPEEQGFIRNKERSETLFVFEGEAASRGAQTNHVHEDLAALWCGIYVQKAEWIVYVTPLRQREYIEKCFTVVKGYWKDKYFGADRDFENEDHPTMSYLGYQTSDAEQGKLASLWVEFEHNHKEFLNLFVEQGNAPGYSAEAVFECAIKYEYLKKNRYSACTFKTEEMLSKEVNTFLRLLYARGLARSLGSYILKKRGHTSMSDVALASGEREIVVHLLQFTEIVEESFLNFTPDLLCEYVWKLSNNFIIYHDKFRLSGSSFLLCKATEVLMDKCFDLLGITPGSSKGLASYWKQQSDKPIVIQDRYIPSPVTRTKTSRSSRIELFSMCVEVSHPEFESGNLFGNITLSDTHASLSDGWWAMDEKDCGRVAYFNKGWHNSVGIRSGSILSFGNPSSCRTVSFSSEIKVGVQLFVTTKKKDACYQLCYWEGEVELLKFWVGGERIERRTFTAKTDNGFVKIFYVLLKDAVDTSFSLSYKPTDGQPKVSGRILAYYDCDAINDIVGYDKELYKAEIFHISSTSLKECNELQLNKSTLSVPTEGTLVIEALLRDADSGEVIVHATRRYAAKDNGVNKWPMVGPKCRFDLKVDWTRDKACC